MSRAWMSFFFVESLQVLVGELRLERGGHDVAAAGGLHYALGLPGREDALLDEDAREIGHRGSKRGT